MTTLVDNTSYVLLSNFRGDILHTESREIQRRLESSRPILSSHECLRTLDKIYGDGHFDIEALRRRIRPEGENRRIPGRRFKGFSTQANRAGVEERRIGG